MTNSVQDKAQAPSLWNRIGMETIEAYLASEGAGRKRSDLDSAITDALAAHLIGLREMGLVRAYDAIPNRRVNEVHDWNVMCGLEESRYSTPDEAARSVAQRLMHALITVHLMMASFDLRDGKDRGEVLAKLQAQVDSGTTRRWLSDMEAHDHVSGETLSLVVRDWNMLLVERSRDAEQKPIADIQPTKLETVDLELPTGDVLISDWFRAEGFTDHVDEGDPWRGGSERESEADTRRYVADHGFASVRTCRTSVSVVTDGRIHGVMRWDEDMLDLPDGLRHVGDMSFSLRQISVIDRESLRGVLSRIHPSARTDELVQEEFSPEPRDAVRIQTTPGRHRVSYSGRGYIHDLLPEGHPFRIEGFEVVMTLEPE